MLKKRKGALNWETGKELFSKANVKEKFFIVNESVVNVLSNFIPHETILYDDKDLTLFNFRIKSLLRARNKILIIKFFKRYTVGLYVLVMSRTRLRVNPHSAVA